ncbi:MAG TPA: F0F1 ATP synthase subunit delta [Candidatus Paceibacterota bacterium]
MATAPQLARYYAQALTRVAAAPGADGSALAKNLIAHLRATGRMKLLPHIARSLKEAHARQGTLSGVVEVAREEERDTALAEAAAAGVHAKTVAVNPALVRGWRARSAGTLIDRSAKRSLIELYQRITSA